MINLRFAFSSESHLTAFPVLSHNSWLFYLYSQNGIVGHQRHPHKVHCHHLLASFGSPPWLWQNSLQSRLDTGRHDFTSWDRKDGMKLLLGQFIVDPHLLYSNCLDTMQMHVDVFVTHLCSAHGPAARQSAGGFTLPPDCPRLCQGTRSTGD